MRVVVGHTGFVGSTLARSIRFDLAFNSRNIGDFHAVPDGSELYLCCLPAQKWVADKNGAEDLGNAMRAFESIRTKRYSEVYLFSTIDVYCHSPTGVDEGFSPGYEFVGYGHNRRLFELMCMGGLSCDRLMVFRLPGLFGQGLKKNIIYDAMNGHMVDSINSNSMYQWYDMDDLVGDVARMRDTKPQERVFNLFNEPIETAELFDKVFGRQYGRHGARVCYDYRTRISRTGYLRTRSEVVDRMRRFVSENRS